MALMLSLLVKIISTKNTVVSMIDFNYAIQLSVCSLDFKNFNCSEYTYLHSLYKF